VPGSYLTAIRVDPERAHGIRIFATDGKPFDILGRAVPEASVNGHRANPSPVVRRPE
jgi:hypothetical protein